MPHVVGSWFSYKHLGRTRLKRLDVALSWQCLCFCLPHLESKNTYSISFLSLSQHLLPDTICSARTWHSINACRMAGSSPSPTLTSPPYSITLKICCRTVGRSLRSILTNNPYECLKPKDRIFRAEIRTVTSWVFCEEMHKAVQTDSLSDRTQQIPFCSFANTERRPNFALNPTFPPEISLCASTAVVKSTVDLKGALPNTFGFKSWSHRFLI